GYGGANALPCLRRTVSRCAAHGMTPGKGRCAAHGMTPGEMARRGHGVRVTPHAAQCVSPRMLRRRRAKPGDALPVRGRAPTASVPRHSGAGRNPVRRGRHAESLPWTPAFAGVTEEGKGTAGRMRSRVCGAPFHAAPRTG